MLETSLLEIFFFSFLLALGGAISPGPVTTTIVNLAVRQGWHVGPLIALGHSLLELIVVGAIALGLQTLMTQASVQIFISIIGGLILLYLGMQTLFNVQNEELPASDENWDTSTKKSSQLILLVAATTLANPFWFAWWISVPQSYLAQVNALEIFPLAAFYLGHISADFAWDSGLAAAVATGRKWMTNRVYQTILSLSGAFLVYLGFSFIRNGWDLLLPF
jgi:threonine/homoserine/homoserine lactone efflux protein